MKILEAQKESLIKINVGMKVCVPQSISKDVLDAKEIYERETNTKYCY